MPRHQARRAPLPVSPYQTLYLANPKAQPLRRVTLAQPTLCHLPDHPRTIRLPHRQQTLPAFHSPQFPFQKKGTL